jgi:Calx-beta domain
MPRRVLIALLAACCALALAAPAAQAQPSISGPASVAESAGTATYTVSEPVGGGDVTISVAGTGQAPATSGSDFGPPSSTTLQFGVGGGTQTITVPVLDDGADEPDEAFTVTATDMFGSNSQTTSITDDDTTIDVAGSTVAEGAAATVTLTPRGPSPHETQVSYGTIPGSAGAADFTAVAPATVTWAPNDTAPKTVTVPTTQDATDEPDEQFGVLFNSSGPSGATLSALGVTITITDDDAPPLVGVAATRTTEGNSGTHIASVLVALSAPSGKAIRVPYRTRDATAGSPSDYGAATGIVTFAPGETTRAIPITIRGDRTAERDEAFGIVLGAPENATLAPGRDSAVITIADDDGGASDQTPPRLRLSAPRARGSRVTLTATCPRTERTCRGTVTLFTVPSRASKISALRQERRLARATFRLAGGRSRGLTLRIGRANTRLLRRAHRVRVRAFAVTSDANGNVGNSSRAATLRFR